MYALLCIGGSYYFIRGATNYSTLWFSLSGCARSNGVLNAGYICYQTMHQAYDAIFLKKCARLAMRVLFAGALRCMCIIMPFISFQAYGYYNLCLGHVSEEMRPWCKARIPFLYNFIQRHYWYSNYHKFLYPFLSIHVLILILRVLAYIYCLLLAF